MSKIPTECPNGHQWSLPAGGCANINCEYTGVTCIPSQTPESREDIAEILRSGNYGYADYATVQKLTAANLAAQKALLERLKAQQVENVAGGKVIGVRHIDDELAALERQQLGKENGDG